MNLLLFHYAETRPIVFIMRPIVLRSAKIAKSPDLADTCYRQKDGGSGTWGVRRPSQVDISPVIFLAVAGILCLIAKYLGGR